MYFLLPFRFRSIQDKEILVSELGNYLIVPRGTAADIVNRKIDSQCDLYKDLEAGAFVSEKPIPDLIDNFAIRLRTKKSFLDEFTTLHIIVLTLRCNQNCTYCQASSLPSDAKHCDMSVGDLEKSIDLIMRSPATAITIEFQGGESSLVPDLIKHAIRYANKLNESVGKQITYVLCSNCIDISDDLLSFCKDSCIFISTSLDGPEQLHNSNRGKKDSFQRVKDGISRARKILGENHISPLMTTSLASLKQPKEIIDSYIELGFSNIFLRPLNPYGGAKDVDWDLYTEQFIDFYKKSLCYILELNLKGIFFAEEFTSIILKKILTPYAEGFVDLQSPAGIINGVAVYNYDGYVYASDESRMLAEIGDYTFRIGKITDLYENLFYGTKAQQLSNVWCTECIAGCSDCAYQTYCGADPVRNYTTQEDQYGFRPTSNFCKLHMQIIDFIFSLLINREREVLPIFQSWLLREVNVNE
jgi:His-Xaa-Ser system radical SAM maturase HxsB